MGTKASSKAARRRRSIGAEEAGTRAERILKVNAELFRRLAGSDAKRQRSTIKRTIKDYRKTLRKLA